MKFEDNSTSVVTPPQQKLRSTLSYHQSVKQPLKDLIRSANNFTESAAVQSAVGCSLDSLYCQGSEAEATEWRVGRVERRKVEKVEGGMP